MERIVDRKETKLPGLALSRFSSLSCGSIPWKRPVSSLKEKDTASVPSRNSARESSDRSRICMAASDGERDGSPGCSVFASLGKTETKEAR